MAAPLKTTAIETVNTSPNTTVEITTTTEIATIDKRQNLPWVAIVYSPNKETRRRSTLNELLGSGIEMPQPAHPLIIGLPVVVPENRKAGLAIDARSVRLSPGTNMGILAADWALCAKHSMIAPKIQSGIICVFTPVALGEAGSPRYYHFPSEVAIHLIQETLHEDWIDEWSTGETNSSISNVASYQKAELIRVKTARAAA